MFAWASRLGRKMKHARRYSYRPKRVTSARNVDVCYVADCMGQQVDGRAAVRKDTCCAVSRSVGGVVSRPKFCVGLCVGLFGGLLDGDVRSVVRCAGSRKHPFMSVRGLRLPLLWSVGSQALVYTGFGCVCVCSRIRGLGGCTSRGVVSCPVALLDLSCVVSCSHLFTY